MANVLRRDRQLAVLKLLAEGNSIRSTERITCVHRDTIMRLLVKTGNQCREFLDSKMRGLSLRHVQVDELWTYCGCKQARIPVENRQQAYERGDQYLWLALDQDTKLIPSWALGKRTGDMARRFMLDLAGRLRTPKPHESDPHAFRAGGYRPIVQISSDAFAGYAEAVDLAFAANVIYGQLVKDYRSNDLPGRYSPAEMVGADRRVVYGDFDAQSICTSHVERTNATVRLFVRRFTRLTLCFSKKLENLNAAIALHLAHYNFCWRPRKPGTSGRKQLTPAMAAGIAGQPWKPSDLFSAVL